MSVEAHRPPYDVTTRRRRSTRSRCRSTSEDATIEDLLRHAVTLGASDVHLTRRHPARRSGCTAPCAAPRAGSR